MADHLSDAADVMPAITGVGLSGCSALDDIEHVNVFLGVWAPYHRSIWVILWTGVQLLKTLHILSIAHDLIKVRLSLV